MPLNPAMRKAFLRRYLVYRIKAMEFFDMAAIRRALLAQQVAIPTPVGRRNEDFADGLRTVLLSWMALFIDKSEDGLDVIHLWKELFPQLRHEIDQAWKLMEPAWDLIRTFRDRAGFHADRPLPFLRARSAIVANRAVVNNALEKFEKLQRKILHYEATTLSDLEAALDDLLDELEMADKGKYTRADWKRYLMIPDTSGRGD